MMTRTILLAAIFSLMASGAFAAGPTTATPPATQPQAATQTVEDQAKAACKDLTGAAFEECVTKKKAELSTAKPATETTTPPKSN